MGHVWDHVFDHFDDQPRRRRAVVDPVLIYPSDRILLGIGIACLCAAALLFVLETQPIR